MWCRNHVAKVDALAAPRVGAEGVDLAEVGLAGGGLRDAGQHAGLDEAQARVQRQGLEAAPVFGARELAPVRLGGGGVLAVEELAGIYIAAAAGHGFEESE